ncbi:hypothetical protein FRB99_001566 [Tulasnella sp. 403]|nr:hypothetical protein FRB99_001566 [Tulasnella sp. 403]
MAQLLATLNIRRDSNPVAPPNRRYTAQLDSFVDCDSIPLKVILEMANDNFGSKAWVFVRGILSLPRGSQTAVLRVTSIDFLASGGLNRMPRPLAEPILTATGRVHKKYAIEEPCLEVEVVGPRHRVLLVLRQVSFRSRQGPRTEPKFRVQMDGFEETFDSIFVAETITVTGHFVSPRRSSDRCGYVLELYPLSVALASTENSEDSLTVEPLPMPQVNPNVDLVTLPTNASDHPVAPSASKVICNDPHLDIPTTSQGCGSNTEGQTLPSSPGRDSMCASSPVRPMSARPTCAHAVGKAGPKNSEGLRGGDDESGDSDEA